MDIQLIRHEDIDKTKWNSCVHYATNGNIFGYKWYLDFVAKEWDGLVEGDYQSVMPLVHRSSRWGRKKIVHPNWMRSLGLYSVNVLSPTRLRNFLQAIPDEYRQIDMRMNEGNHPTTEMGFPLVEYQNHFLVLADPFEQLLDKFSREVLVGLDRANDANLIPIQNIKPEEVADFYVIYGPSGRNRETESHALLRIMYNVLHRGWGFSTAVKNSEGTLLAANFLIFSHGRVLSLVPVESPEGKAVSAQDFLFHSLIERFAGQKLILDFNTESPSDLASRFGAEPIPYFGIRKKAAIFSR